MEDFVEILGNNLEQVLKELDIDAKLGFKSEEYEVWALSHSDFDKLSNQSGEDFDKFENSWWRHSEGSIIGSVNKRFIINGHYIMAWKGNSDDLYGNKFKSITDYILNILGLSTETNICSLSVELAYQNNLSLGELFNKYQK